MNQIRNRYLLLADIAACFLGFFIAIAFVLPFSELWAYFSDGLLYISATALIYVLVLMALGTYNSNWVYAGQKEYSRLIRGCFIAFVLSIVLGLFINNPLYYLKFNIGASFLASVFIYALRFGIRLLFKRAHRINKKEGKRTLVIGAGSLAMALLRDINENKEMPYYVVGLIDDDDAKQKLYYYGKKVVGKRTDIEHICKNLGVEEIIFAIDKIDSADRTAILDICSKTGKKVKIVPGLASSMSNVGQSRKIREINIVDLLEREPINLENEPIEKDLKGKTVMVTGGGGSIGSELCRQIAKFGPETLIILDIYENTTYELQNQLEEDYPGLNLEVLIASVRDMDRLCEIFEKYNPDVIFHAAAHKHVPLMEFSPGEAIKNNILGTYNVARCAFKYGSDRFILISTDKAVNPTNVMGASKRVCEMIVQTMQKDSKTEFAAVRFGNVLGSNGSVIPRFKKQIENGGPVTVTHPEITRFFMTIPEAAQLVLQAASYADGGEIFVLDMGKPVKILDLAKKMIQLSGLKPEEDIKITFTGLRPGEKLYEELLMNEEGLRRTVHDKIFVGQPIDIEKEQLIKNIKKLESVISSDADTIRKTISEVVPTYKYTPNKKQ